MGVVCIVFFFFKNGSFKCLTYVWFGFESFKSTFWGQAYTIDKSQKAFYRKILDLTLLT